MTVSDLRLFRIGTRLSLACALATGGLVLLLYFGGPTGISRNEIVATLWWWLGFIAVSTAFSAWFLAVHLVRRPTFLPDLASRRRWTNIVVGFAFIGAWCFYARMRRS